MLTWLDEMVAYLGKTAREAGLTGLYKSTRRSTDFEMTKVAIKVAFDETLRPALGPGFTWRRAPSEDEKWAVWLAVFAYSARDFLYPGQYGPASPLGLQVARELADDFAEAKPPETIEWQALLKHHRTVYIDFPPETFWVDSTGTPMTGRFYLRAVLVNSPEGRNESHTSFYAIFDRRERQCEVPNMIRFFVDEHGRPVPPAREDQVFTFGQNAETLHALEGQVSDLVRLVLLYYQSTDQRVESLPYLGPIKLEATPPAKRPERQRAESLFKIQRLLSPVGRFGRERGESAPREGYKLGVRVRVRGHFRWQPHGPGRELRRLQWIDPYLKGPADAPVRVPMYRVDAVKEVS